MDSLFGNISRQDVLGMLEQLEPSVMTLWPASLPRLLAGCKIGLFCSVVGLSVCKDKQTDHGEGTQE